MDIQTFLDITHTIGRLKDVTRHCYTPGGRHESVAEHTYRIALMACFLRDEFPEADVDKIIRMCLIHDLGEIFTGDIPVFLKTAQDETKEAGLLGEWVNSLPAPYREEMASLYREMEKRESLEAKIYKALDNLEALISHNESDLSTWEENEYSLQRVYGVENCSFDPYFRAFRALVLQETEDKIRDGEAAREEGREES